MDSKFEEDRKLVAQSMRRLKFAFTLFVVTMLVGLSALMFSMVTNIFDRLTPSTRSDLEWKVRRGAQELARSTQLGMVLSSPDPVREAAADYLADPEVLGLVVRDSRNEVVFTHDKGALESLAEGALFSGEPASVHETPELFRAWAPSEIEGAQVGSVAIAVSKTRLAAGKELRADILLVGGGSALLVLGLTLGFVGFYIGPILQTTNRTFQRLEETTEAALAATRLKSEFLANMSHEIRTPMNGIIGVLDLVRRTALSPKQRRYVQTIDSSARSLLTIINDILDFSKLEAGKYDIQQADLEPVQLVQEVGELLAPKAHAKGLELVQRVDPDVPSCIVGDVERLKQVLTNLVGNAVKFTDEGHIVVRVRRDDATTDDPSEIKLRFEVTDTGLGIHEEGQKKLFAMFSQVDGSLTRQHGGTGLGLAISKRLIEAMGGVIGVESAPGSGSTFWFTITTRQGHIQRRALMPNRHSNVLVIVRDEAHREGLMAQLQSWGMRGAAATDAKHGCDLVMNSDPDPFDLAIIDVLDERDGHAEELLDLCALEGLSLVRLIQTTDSIPAGPTALPQVVLTKPVRVSELYNGIVSLLDGVRVETVQQPDNDTLPQTRPRDATILVVDDNEINRLVACDLLEEFGYSHHTAENGAQAVELARSGAYAAILMDCQMPVMDGYQATKAIRALEGDASRVPIIAATAHAMAGDREKVLAAGMDDYTAKPVRARALERLLSRWIKNAPVEQADATSVPSKPSSEPGVPASGHSKSWLDCPLLDPTVARSPRLIEIFLRCFPDDVEAVVSALRDGDSDVVRKAAHKLKGGSLSLGALQLAEAALYIEREAAEQRTDAAMGSELRELFAQTRELLHGEPGSSAGGR